MEKEREHFENELEENKLKFEKQKELANVEIEHAGKIKTEQFDTVISAVGIVGNIEGLGVEKLPFKIENI